MISDFRGRCEDAKRTRVWVGPGGNMVAITPYTRLKPTPAPEGGPLGLIDFVFGRNRAVVQNRCEPVEVRFRIFGVVVRGRKG